MNVLRHVDVDNKNIYFKETTRKTRVTLSCLEIACPMKWTCRHIDHVLKLIENKTPQNNTFPKNNIIDRYIHV
jgi:hypothetical protein